MLTTAKSDLILNDKILGSFLFLQESNSLLVFERI